jgi:hypothetical protein
MQSRQQCEFVLAAVSDKAYRTSGHASHIILYILQSIFYKRHLGGISTMKSNSAEKIRNIAMVGHGGEGKTTLTEAMLFGAGSTDRMGPPRVEAWRAAAAGGRLGDVYGASVSMKRRSRSS